MWGRYQRITDLLIYFGVTLIVANVAFEYVLSQVSLLVTNEIAVVCYANEGYEPLLSR